MNSWPSVWPKTRPTNNSRKPHTAQTRYARPGPPVGRDEFKAVGVAIGACALPPSLAAANCGSRNRRVGVAEIRHALLIEESRPPPPCETIHSTTHQRLNNRPRTAGPEKPPSIQQTERRYLLSGF